MNLLLALLLPFIQESPVEKPQDPVPEKVEGVDLVDEAVQTFSLPPVTRVTYEGANVPTVKVLRNLQKITGWDLYWKYIKEDRPVTVSWKEVTPLEAFDDLCRKGGGLRYRIQMESEWNQEKRQSESKGVRVRFERGSFPVAPVTHYRHYRVSLRKMTLTRETDYSGLKEEGTMQVRFLWTPDVVPPFLQSFKIGAIQDDQGNSLLSPETNQMGGRSRKFQSSGRYRTQYVHVSFPFQYPGSEVKTLSRVKGRAVLRYVEKARPLFFRDPGEKEGVAREYRGLTIQVEDYRASMTSVSLKIRVEGKWDAPSDPRLDRNDRWLYPFGTGDVELVAGDGSSLEQERSGYSGGSKGMTFNFVFKNPGKKKVTMLRIRCAEKYLYDEIPFEWKDVKLPGTK